MDIVIAGGHGQIALLLSRRLADRGDRVRGLIRSPDQGEDLRNAGSEPVVLDLEHADVDEIARAAAGADAVVFAAGAGPGSGAHRKETVDYAAAGKLRHAAVKAEIRRYVMISAMGTDEPPPEDPTGDDVFAVYLRAKADADRELMETDLDWTIIRPARLTDDPGTGRVTLDRHVERGRIPRADVAAVVAAVLADVSTAGHIIEVVSGPTPIDEAIASLA